MSNFAANVSLQDKYVQESGRILLSGVQALVRLPLMQHARDVADGLNTAGFITGYRGSPLGGYDLQLQAAKERLEAAHVLFQPGLNEDLAATAVWGTQQANLVAGAKYDGVFAMWYGKGPGVDRSGDPIKHGNRMGTAKYGGVLLVFGDDHPGKSSTISHQSEQALAANGVPVLYPATVQEYLDFGLHGFALSRVAGVWVGFKCVNETVETTATVNIAPHRVVINEITGARLPAEGVHSRLVFDPLRDEVRLMRFKLPLAQAYVRANRLDRVTHDAPRRLLGLIAAGKSWVDLMSALSALGIDAERAAILGVRVYKPAMIWPLEPTGLADFARGHRELFFIEEKAAFMELQASHALYNLPNTERPRIVGKVDDAGAPLLPADVQLDPLDIAIALGRRLRALGMMDDSLAKRLEYIERQADEARARLSGPLTRAPYFCSGCPHNTSTQVPEGSIALAGIGCHTMAMAMNRNTLPPTQMGGEGANWVGMAPFTNTSHIFQNLGDGTYVHSGLLAVRAAAVAGVNVTYKILVNDAVAMTGGQLVEGHFSVAEITHQLRAERVQRIVVVTDNVAKYGTNPGFAQGVTLHDRAALEELQRELREVRGVSALIYEQTCAAEKRRRSKRNPKAAPERRVFINARVCEGCGDCSVQSNCVSIEPLETPYGRKRRINQSSCNKDYSCIKGFCPSFLVIEGLGLSEPAPQKIAIEQIGVIPEPPRAVARHAMAMLITGIGGTGVVTIGAVLAMAAHLEGLSASVYDMTGLAQKGGAVLSHLRIGTSDDSLAAARIGLLAADVVIGCDLIVTVSAEVLGAIASGHTQVLLNTHLVPTAAFQQNPNLDFQDAVLLKRLVQVAGDSAVRQIDATAAALTLLGDSIATNMLMVGFALQQGLLPVSVAAVQRAIELNGVAVAFNLRALTLGRLAAHDITRFRQFLLEANPAQERAPDESLAALIARNAAELTEYQSATYASRYQAVVEAAAAAEGQFEEKGFAAAVARYYFKLLAYKDEYEVARLQTDEKFRAELDAIFAPGYRIAYQLAPPFIGAKDPYSGLPRKMQFGGWVRPLFEVLAKFKFLRGTRLDPFGLTAERRMERKLIADYESRAKELIRGLHPDNHALAIDIASLPELIRGYGHIKARAVKLANARTDELMSAWRASLVLAPLTAT